MRIGIYAGTFDPVTNGHMSIIKRAAKVFDLLIVGIAIDANKNTLFTLDERVSLVQASIAILDNVTVEIYPGLTTDFAIQKNATALVRGLRVVSDFEYEMQMASFNKHLSPDIETVFFTADTEFAFVSSSMIKNIAILNGDIDIYVPTMVRDALKVKYGF